MLHAARRPGEEGRQLVASLAARGGLQARGDTDQPYDYAYAYAYA